MGQPVEQNRCCLDGDLTEAAGTPCGPDVGLGSVVRDRYLYVAIIPFVRLKQLLPSNSDGGDLPDEDVMPVAHRDS
jgi:hypothetical protein